MDIGLFEGASPSFGDFLWNNLLPVTLGNFAGGAGLIGLVQWATHSRRRRGGGTAAEKEARGVQALYPEAELPQEP